MPQHLTNNIFVWIKHTSLVDDYRKAWTWAPGGDGAGLLVLIAAHPLRVLRDAVRLVLLCLLIGHILVPCHVTVVMSGI